MPAPFGAVDGHLAGALEIPAENGDRRQFAFENIGKIPPFVVSAMVSSVD